jgi:multimeric flavodoxin WrbA
MRISKKGENEMTKKVLFLCGSPRRKKSASLYTAKYLAQFLDNDFEFVDVVGAKLSTDPTEAEPAFLKIVEKIQRADAVIWTFGAWCLFVPVQMQYLLDKLFTHGYEFKGKIAAAVMTSRRIYDDLILSRVHFVSEQLGFGYVGDVSAIGNPLFGYEDDEETTEGSCRVLAGQLNRALKDGYVPAKRYMLVEQKYLAPISRGHEFPVNGPPTPKTGDKTILVITGNRLTEDPANASIVESIKQYSKNSIEILELKDHDVGPCIGCYLCDFRVEGVCVLKDEYETIKQRLHQVDGIVYIGTCASGMVDPHLKAFLERCWGIYHRPSLKGKYGLVVATGGGPLEADTASRLQIVMNWTGTRCIAALTHSAAEGSEFALTLRRTVEDLDLALEEKWQIADRFGSRGSTWALRDLAATNGMMLRADYKFHKEHKMFDYPSPGGVNALMRLLFKSKTLEQKLIPLRQKQLTKSRKRRLEAYLQQSGHLGEGKEISI